MLMPIADQRVAFPVSDLTTLFNMPWTLANRSATKDLPASVTTACIPLTVWPAAGFVDTKLRCFTKLEVGYGEAHFQS